MTERGGLAPARNRRTVLFGRLFAAALMAIVFAILWLVFHRRLVPYYVPWTGARHGGLYADIAWLDRAVVILSAVLLLARVMRLTGSSEVMRAPLRGVAIMVHSILLGMSVFALWLPGCGDLADVSLLMVLGGLAAIFSGIVLALARFRSRYWVESGLASLLPLVGIGCLAFFAVLLAEGRLD